MIFYHWFSVLSSRWHDFRLFLLCVLCCVCCLPRKGPESMSWAPKAEAVHGLKQRFDVLRGWRCWSRKCRAWSRDANGSGTGWSLLDRHTQMLKRCWCAKLKHGCCVAWRLEEVTIARAGQQNDARQESKAVGAQQKRGEADVPGVDSSRFCCFGAGVGSNFRLMVWELCLADVHGSWCILGNSVV